MKHTLSVRLLCIGNEDGYIHLEEVICKGKWSDGGLRQNSPQHGTKLFVNIALLPSSLYWGYRYGLWEYTSNRWNGTAQVWNTDGPR